ncbi:MAG: NEW3 domain-containing protein [Actinobacteria bacterium]|nr:NEW3 domain-containing protein [Actinomycetota bacterium]
MKKGSKKFRNSLIATIILLTLSFVLLIPGVVLAATTTSTGDTTTETTINIPPEVTFNCTYPELKAKEGNPFAFQVEMNYVGNEEATFNLTANAPQGWYVAIEPSYQAGEISAIKLQPGKSETLKVTATALIKQNPGEYDITIKATNDALKVSKEIKLKAIITATYDMTLTSKTGMLNTKATSGKDNTYIIVIQNTGSANLDNIALKSDAPEKWNIKFDTDKIETLKPDESKDIKVTITPPEKTIAGDYMLTLSANSTDSNKSIDVRVTVETPSVWGWIGIGIIVIVIVGVAVIFSRLGRR